MPKLSSYPAATDLTNATFPIVQGGANKQASAVLVGSNAPYTYPGTGAVQRTLQSRLSDRISVKDFGPTGTSDDTATFNACFAYVRSLDATFTNSPLPS